MTTLQQCSKFIEKIEFFHHGNRKLTDKDIDNAIIVMKTLVKELKKRGAK